MKLKLTPEGSIQILTMTESVSAQDVEIIKAGISKLLRNGKNKIILESVGIDVLPDNVIRDIGALDHMARELSGRVVMVSSSSALKKKLEAFASPPLVLFFEDRKKAIAAISDSTPLDETAPKSGLKEGRKEEPKRVSEPAVAATPVDTVLAHELGELGRVRRELAEMKKENEILHQQLLIWVDQRRKTASPSSLIDKIRALELEIEKLLATSSPSKSNP